MKCSGSASPVCEYGSAKEQNIAFKPEDLTFEQAASLPSSAITALQGLRDKGGIESGRKVLIVGALGGVGSFAVQIAKAFGAEVTGVCSTTKTALVRSIGADHVVDYTREDFTRGNRRYDIILDTAGNRSLGSLRRVLAPDGTLVLVGGEDGGTWLGGIDRFLAAALLSPFTGQTLRGFIAAANQDDLQTLRELVGSGQVTPVIDRTYPLADAAEAVRYLAEFHASGKIVLTI